MTKERFERCFFSKDMEGFLLTKKIMILKKPLRIVNVCNNAQLIVHNMGKLYSTKIDGVSVGEHIENMNNMPFYVSVKMSQTFDY